MVNPGGTHTMLGQWRIVLKQAEEAARNGRFDEALALASRPDVADHKHGVGLRARLSEQLVARARRRAEADDSDGAVSDLVLAERHGAAPDRIAEVRKLVADGVAEDVKLDLDAGDPSKVADRLTRLAEAGVTNASLRRLREAAEAWRGASADARRGEFGAALEGVQRAERLCGGPAGECFASAIRDLTTRREAAAPRVERLYAALGSGDWGATLAAADGVLELVPEHPAARQARTRAWQQIGGISPSASLPGRDVRPAPNVQVGPRPAVNRGQGIVFLDSSDIVTEPVTRREPIAARPAPASTRTPTSPVSFRNPAPGLIPAATPPRPRSEGSLKGRFLLWADAIGGYLVCLDDEIVLGRSGVDGSADVAILGDLSRRHAVILRDGDTYVLRAVHQTFVNGRKIETAPLRSGDVIRLGSSVELEFQQPSPVSSTARLRVASHHRLPLSIDGVILMAETCIVGAAAQAHVPAPALETPVVLYRQGGTLWCRAPGAFEVDGQPRVSRSPLSSRSSVRGEGFSFSLEPMPSHGTSPA